MFIYFKFNFYRYFNTVFFWSKYFRFKPISLPGNINYYSGVFEKELIAGGYILMFSIIGIFGIPIILQKINKIYLIFIFLFGITIFIIALLLSGNRMPSIMFLFFVLILSLIVNKKQFRFHFFCNWIFNTVNWLNINL